MKKSMLAALLTATTLTTFSVNTQAQEPGTGIDISGCRSPLGNEDHKLREERDEMRSILKIALQKTNREWTPEEMAMITVVVLGIDCLKW